MKRFKFNQKIGEKPNIDLTVRRVEPEVWDKLQFSKYHYLTSSLNKSCKCLLFEWGDTPVAFVGILNTPRKGMPYGCSISRIVILPSFNGFGLFRRIVDFVGGIVKSQSDDEHDYQLYIKTAHTLAGKSLERNERWSPTSYNGKARKVDGCEQGKYNNRLTRLSYCYKYVGDKIEGYDELLKPIGELRKSKVSSEPMQLSFEF